MHCALLTALFICPSILTSTRIVLTPREQEIDAHALKIRSSFRIAQIIASEDPISPEILYPAPKHFADLWQLVQTECGVHHKDQLPPFFCLEAGDSCAYVETDKAVFFPERLPPHAFLMFTLYHEASHVKYGDAYWNSHHVSHQEKRADIEATHALGCEKCIAEVAAIKTDRHAELGYLSCDDMLCIAYTHYQKKFCTRHRHTKKPK